MEAKASAQRKARSDFAAWLFRRIRDATNSHLQEFEQDKYGPEAVNAFADRLAADYARKSRPSELTTFRRSNGDTEAYVLVELEVKDLPRSVAKKIVAQFSSQKQARLAVEELEVAVLRHLSNERRLLPEVSADPAKVPDNETSVSTNPNASSRRDIWWETPPPPDDDPEKDEPRSEPKVPRLERGRFFIGFTLGMYVTKFPAIPPRSQTSSDGSALLVDNRGMGFGIGMFASYDLLAKIGISFDLAYAGRSSANNIYSNDVVIALHQMNFVPEIRYYFEGPSPQSSYLLWGYERRSLLSAKSKGLRQDDLDISGELDNLTTGLRIGVGYRGPYVFIELFRSSMSDGLTGWGISLGMGGFQK